MAKQAYSERTAAENADKEATGKLMQAQDKVNLAKQKMDLETKHLEDLQHKLADAQAQAKKDTGRP